MSTPVTQADYKQEVRFAVVMYGGVSLAIYINGIAQELLHLVKSTGRENVGKELSGTESIYREISYLLGEDPTQIDFTREAPPTRFIVDIVSGTSAGGINGIFLAKALVNGQDMDRLKDLWITEGDIETLINDKRSIEKPLKLQDPPSSLLNSERMYYELLKAFNLMDDSRPARKEQDSSPLVDELDLFVTSTDLQGVVLPIGLSDSFVYERRHRNVMHFVYSEPNIQEPTRNDFFRKYNPFLAYAARCTSSFPFAFEPMALSDIDTLLNKVTGYQTNDDWKSTSPDWFRFYHDYRLPRDIPSVPFPDRPFGDGGYLDNKPFTYATETLMSRTATLPVDRKLLYIEPSPEHPEDDVEQEGKPDAIDNVMSALLTLPRYETIREDLERINERNRLIDRVNALTSGVDRDQDTVSKTSPDFYGDETQRWKQWGALVTPNVADELWAQDQLSDKEHGDLDLTDVIKRKGRAYAAYVRLRVSAVTDDLAKLITRVAGFDENSDYSLIIRSIIRAWRIKKYIEYRQSAEDTTPTVNRFLFEFDLAYPIRRINYLRSKVDALFRFHDDALTVIAIQARKFDVDPERLKTTPKLRNGFTDEVLSYKAELNRLFVLLRHTARSVRSRQSVARAEKDASLHVSPLQDQVSQLITQISAAVTAANVDVSTPTVLEYFLGKRRPNSGEQYERSYKAASAKDICIARAEQFLNEHDEIRNQIEEVAEALSKTLEPVKAEVEQRILGLFTATSTKALDPDPEVDTVKWIAKYCIGHHYQHYEDYDLLTYPILYDTNVGEADIIDVIRVSPEDATQLINERATGCHKLAGTTLGHFGAFLQQSWRENDILWGRLDGAERIISALLPNHPQRQKLIGRAQATIICEAIEKLGDDLTYKLLSESLMRTLRRKPDIGLLNEFVANLFAYCNDDQNLCARLTRLVDPRKLNDYYVANFQMQSKLDPEPALKSLARATTVIGKILASLSTERRVDTKYALWIARLGQIFWAMVEVAVPQSFANIVFRHALKLVYFLEALLIVGATLLAQPQMQQFGVTSFAITAGIHLAVIVLGDLLKSRNRWLNLAKALLVLAVVVLVTVGAFSLSAVFGVESTWKVLNSARSWIAEPGPIGFNLRTVFRFVILIPLVILFVMAIGPELKAIFQRKTSRNKNPMISKIS